MFMLHMSEGSHILRHAFEFYSSLLHQVQLSKITCGLQVMPNCKLTYTPSGYSTRGYGCIGTCTHDMTLTFRAQSHRAQSTARGGKESPTLQHINRGRQQSHAPSSTRRAVLRARCSAHRAPPSLLLLFQLSQTCDKLFAQKAPCSLRPAVPPYSSARSLRTWSLADPRNPWLSVRPRTPVSLAAPVPARTGIRHRPHLARRLRILCRADTDRPCHRNPALGSPRACPCTFRRVQGCSCRGHTGSAHPPPRDGPCIHGTVHTTFS